MNAVNIDLSRLPESAFYLLEYCLKQAEKEEQAQMLTLVRGIVLLMVLQRSMSFLIVSNYL